jgi:hypothetical protein
MDSFRRGMGIDRRRILGVAAAAALALAGCGGDDEPAAGTDLTTIRCPLVPTGEKVGGAQQYEPAEDAFDTAELIGQKLDEAGSTAGEHGCEVVVAMRDGEGLPVPTDVDPKRIYVYTEDGVVTEIEGVGGGI